MTAGPASLEPFREVWLGAWVDEGAERRAVVWLDEPLESVESGVEEELDPPPEVAPGAGSGEGDGLLATVEVGCGEGLGDGLPPDASADEAGPRQTNRRARTTVLPNRAWIEFEANNPALPL